MKKTALSSVCLILAAGVPFGCSPAPPAAPEPAAAKPAGALVDPAWLEQHLDDPGVRIIDLSRKKETYHKGHVRGAAFVDWIADITDPAKKDRFNVAPKKQIQTLLRKLGVGKKTTIVLYDDLDNRLSTRMFWTLRYYGHDAVHILNGGRKAWKRAEGKFVTEVPAFDETDYKIGPVNSTFRTNLKFIEANLKDSQVVLIDGRPAGQYSGAQPGKVFHTGTEHAAKGHIPGAINILWKDNLNPDGTFKSVEELRKLYEARGVTSEKTVITYCNEGLHAAPPWFVLTALLGYRHVRLYDDSMAEWANNDRVPIKTGTKP